MHVARFGTGKLHNCSTSVRHHFVVIFWRLKHELLKLSPSRLHLNSVEMDIGHMRITLIGVIKVITDAKML